MEHFVSEKQNIDKQMKNAINGSGFMTKEEKREYNKQYRILHKEEIAERMNKYAKEHRCC